jgi:hypothetical protein
LGGSILHKQSVSIKTSMKRGWKQYVVWAEACPAARADVGFNQNLNEKRMETEDYPRGHAYAPPMNVSIKTSMKRGWKLIYSNLGIRYQLSEVMFQSKPQ